MASRQIPALDGLRGVALLLVLLLHFRAPDLQHPMKGLLGFGWVGVQLFFVLSGFLITGILLDSRRAPNYFSSFWMRRLLRIVPLYFAALAVFLGAFPALVESSSKYLPNQSDRVYFWCYLNNWVTVPADGRLEHILGHFWSLAVEEQFYLVWPVVVWALPSRRLFVFCLISCFAVLIARTWSITQGWNSDWIYRNTLLRSDALMLGAMAAIALRQPDWRRWILRWTRPALWGCAVAGAAVLVAGHGTHYLHPPVLAAGLTVFAAAFTAGLTAIVTGTVDGRWLAHPALGWLGRRSYGMYVWHWPMAYAMYYSYPWAGVHGTAGQVLMLTAGLAGSCVLGEVSYQLFERHFLHFKQYFRIKPEHAHQPRHPATKTNRPVRHFRDEPAGCGYGIGGGVDSRT